VSIGGAANMSGTRDRWITIEAIATALVALEQLPAERQPSQLMLDLRQLLAISCGAFEISLHLAQAKCRLFPDLDPVAVYQEHGIDWHE
jgi:hypothetical protein